MGLNLNWPIVISSFDANRVSVVFMYSLNKVESIGITFLPPQCHCWFEVGGTVGQWSSLNSNFTKEFFNV